MTESHRSATGEIGRKRWPHRIAAAVGVLALSAAVGFAVRWVKVDDALSASVVRGTLRIHVVESGTLQPLQSITYRSPLAGRETEIVFLAPEGARVQKGDLIARLDATELQRELERAVLNLRQAEVDETVARLDVRESEADLVAVRDGGAALAAEEERLRFELAGKRVKRLRAELESLQPLLERGFITREELDRVAFELEQAEGEYVLAQRKSEVYAGSTRPREVQQAERMLAQRRAQRENAHAKLEGAKSQALWLQEMIERSSLYARQPGLVIYEEYLAANPRRKVRLGDRVTPSQGLVTIPEVDRMVVETSVREADVHRISLQQPAVIRVDAFPDLRLEGRVSRIGTMARSSGSQGFEEKRFDVVVELSSTDANLRPEMTARADILVEELNDVLLAPVNAVFEREGGFVAHVLTPWGTRTTTVELGASDGTEVEIRAGLREGDRLRLEDLAAASPREGAPSTAPSSAPGGQEFAPR